MKIERKVIEKETEVSLDEFATKHDLTLEITENKREPSYRQFACNFKNCEIATFSEPNILRSVVSYGYTEVEAINNYINQIKKKTLVLNSGHGKFRRDIDIPELTTFKG